MAVTKRIFFGVASFGDAPKVVLDRVGTMRFVFYNFQGLEQKRHEYVNTSSLEAFGYLWRFHLYPRGHKEGEDVSIFLEYVGDAKYKPVATCSFRCKHRIFDNHTDDTMWGRLDYLKREDVLVDWLEHDGSLVIDVDLQITVDSKRIFWYPKLNKPNDVLTKLYHSSSEDDTNTSDAMFDVDGKEFHGHKIFLSVRSPTLSELMKDDNNTNNDGVVVVPIPNMDSHIFEGVLKFIYYIEIPTIEDATTATKYLHAANRLGIVDLKMYVESMIVEKFLDTSNAAEMLILADSYSCPLLKETTMKLYENDTGAVMESEGWSQLKESPHLLVDLLQFAYKRKQQQYKKMKQQQQSSTGSDNHNVVDDVINLDVISLRERLLEVNLDIDGNQEILMERLKNHISSPSRDSACSSNASSPPPAAAAAAAALAAGATIPQRQLRPRQPRRCKDDFVAPPVVHQPAVPPGLLAVVPPPAAPPLVADSLVVPPLIIPSKVVQNPAALPVIPEEVIQPSVVRAPVIQANMPPNLPLEPTEEGKLASSSKPVNQQDNQNPRIHRPQPDNDNQSVEDTADTTKYKKSRSCKTKDTNYKD